ncbi:MAG: alpha/beta fold hydrolase [Gemmatimonadetes bacterium]|nr:alpha/beta fold hydrolase [Gemmatimonadota bacterium]
MTCRGWLSTPDAGVPPFPCVVMGMGATYVKEFPIIKGHLEAFTRHGLAAIVFDYRYFGASDGVPRQHIEPWDQIEDIRNAISLAETLPDIDPERLGYWGASQGGSHAFIVPALDPRVKCSVSVVGGVAGADYLRVSRPAKVFERLQQVILEDRRKRFKDEAQRGYVPMVSQDPERDLIYAGFGRQSGEGNYELFMHASKVAPAWENRVTIESFENKLRYDPTPFLPSLLSVPLLVIVLEGDALVPPEQTIDAYHRVPSPSKKLLVVPSDGGKVTHVTVYTNPSHTAIIATAAAGFLAEHLVKT